MSGQISENGSPFAENMRSYGCWPVGGGIPPWQHPGLQSEEGEVGRKIIDLAICRKNDEKRFGYPLSEAGYKESEIGIFGFRQFHGVIPRSEPAFQRLERLKTGNFLYEYLRFFSVHRILFLALKAEPGKPDEGNSIVPGLFLIH